MMHFDGGKTLVHWRCNICSAIFGTLKAAQRAQGRHSRTLTAGIRASLIDKNGKFVPDTLMIRNDDSQLHILNYNSPGATGALPTGAMIASQLIEAGFAKSATHNGHNIPWDLSKVADEMRLS